MSFPAAEFPSRRYLTTPSGKLNFGNALARRRQLAKQFKGRGYGKFICAGALRTEFREETEAHANPMQFAADAVDAVLTAFEIFGDDVNRGDLGAALKLLSRRPAEIDRHVALNDAGRAFLIRARATVSQFERVAA
jgi:hypothetical protein